MMIIGVMRISLFFLFLFISILFWSLFLLKDIRIGKICLLIVSFYIVLYVFLFIKKFDMFVEIFKKDVCLFEEV